MGQTCDIIDEAVRRYYDMIFYPGNAARAFDSPPIAVQNVPQFRAFLDVVEINLRQPCEFLPYIGMVESCNNVF